MTASTSLRRRLLLVALSTTLVGLVALDARSTYGARTTADEPQYLLTALSLGTDGDLDVSDEIASGSYRRFHEAELDPQSMVLNDQGQQLSPHDPLLPALLSVPTTVGGWPAAKVTLALIAGAAAAFTLFLAVDVVGVRERTATWTVGLLFASPPLTVYATQVYPEIPAALCVAVGLIAIGRGDRGRRLHRWIVAGLIAVVALPWLGVKYVPVAGVLALGLLWVTFARSPRLAAGAAAMLAGCGVAYLAVHQSIYGGWTVYAAGDHFVGGEFTVVGADPNYLGRSRRLLGLLVDRGFGLMAWTPAYVLAMPSLVALGRRRPPIWVWLLAITTMGWASATWVALTMHGWWWPGRQLVVILPCVVVAMAHLVDRLPRLNPVLMGGAVLGIATWLLLVWEASTGRRTLIVDFESTSNPWYRLWSSALPDHRSWTGGDQLLTALWALALAGLCAVVWRGIDKRVDSDA